jgi:hypothetical protein
MEENQLYALVWKLVAVVLSVVILTLGSCTAYQTYRITESQDPIAAKCAISDNGNTQACLTILGRK